jgi:hypothetical protein
MKSAREGNIMNFGLALNVAISLTFVYVLASLLASTVNEMIAGALKLRGVYLTRAIESLTSLGTGNMFAWGGFTGWCHAYFRQTTAEVSKGVDIATRNAVEAGQQALADAAKPHETPAPEPVIDQVTKAMLGADGVAAQSKLKDAITAAANAAEGNAAALVKALQPAMGIAILQQHPLLIGTPSSLPSYVPSRDFASAMLSQLTDGSVTNGFTQAQAAINSLPDGDLKRTLLAFISAGADDLDKLRTRIENWFDDAMERLSGIYKRFSQYVMLALGLIIASVMNVNSVQLARMFWDEPAVSSAISAGAAKFMTDDKDQFLACSTTHARDDGANAPAAAICPPEARLTAVQDMMDHQSLPIGRVAQADLFGCVHGANGSPNACQLPGSRLWTIFGWIITAFAISLGAQFWFGVLTNLTSLRAAGDKPKRANEVPPAA